MNINNRLSITKRCWHSGVFFIAATSLSLSHAATLWTGPTINFTQSPTTESDVVLPGKVVLTRGGNQVLFNTAAGELSWGASSPLDTEWAFGGLNNYSNLTYQTLESMRNTDLAGLILNQPMVMHIKNEDIYLSVKFTAWGQSGVGGFAYTRSTPAAAPPRPTVSITSPAAGASFNAPANVDLTSTATVSGGTVANVEYFASGTSLGSAAITPFHVSGTISTPGSYDLTAVATAAGVSATSAVVNITVTAVSGPPTVAITAPTDGTVFTAPGNLTITADASVSSGIVTNVSFFTNSTLLQSVENPPFTATSNNLAPGDYALTAVATVAGVSSTSSVVNIRVVSPVPVSLGALATADGLFSLSYNADAGISYVVQSSSNLLDWVSVVTNVASSNPVFFSDNLGTNVPHFYRVGRLTGP